MANVSKVACIGLVKMIVLGFLCVVTSVQIDAIYVHRVRDNVKIDVYIVSATDDVESHVHLVGNYAHGVVSITNVVNYVVNHVTVKGVISPAERFFRVDISASDFVGSHAQQIVEFVIKRKLLNSCLETRTNLMQDLSCLRTVEPGV